MKTILLIGETGTGKSSLGNFIVGENVFEVSDKPEGCTKKLIEKQSKIFKNIEVIDTAGYNDSKNFDKKNYENILEYLSNKKKLELILMTFNYQFPRLTNSNKNFIRFLSNAFPKNICHHLAFAFTHFDYIYQQKLIKNKNIAIGLEKKKFILQIMKIISEETNEKLFTEPPIIFIDSVFKDKYSISQLNNLISFTKTLTSLDVFQKKELFIKTEDYEYDERKRVYEDENNIITEIRVYKRKIQIFYDGTVNYTNWRYCYTDKKTEEKKIVEKEEDKKEEPGFFTELCSLGLFIFMMVKIISKNK